MKVSSTRRSQRTFTVSVAPSVSELLLSAAILLPAVYIHLYKAETLMWSLTSFVVFGYLSATSIPGSSQVTLSIDSGNVLIERTKFFVVPAATTESKTDLISGIKLESAGGELDGVKVGKKVGWRLLLGYKEGYAVPFFEGWLAGDSQRRRLEQAGRDMAQLMDVSFSIGDAPVTATDSQ
ncbi:hypothetical protein RI367_002141 [Sorochytrium milnesiophthora]